MINNLIKVLSNEEKALNELLAILDEQHKKIVSKDIFGLEEVVEKIQQANREIAMYEVERRKLIGNKTMKDIIGESKNEEVDNGYRRIKRVLNSITIQKDTNDLLIRQGLSYTNKMLGLITPKRETSVYNSYGSIRR